MHTKFTIVNSRKKAQQTQTTEMRFTNLPKSAKRPDAASAIVQTAGRDGSVFSGDGVASVLASRLDVRFPTAPAREYARPTVVHRWVTACPFRLLRLFTTRGQIRSRFYEESVDKKTPRCYE